MTKQNNKQSGNVFVFILLGVILFGALIYTFTRGGQQGISSLTKKQAEILASDVINYGRLLEQTVNKLRRQGCSETQISFFNSIVAGYSNPNSPLDGSCNVFDENGGKIDFVSPPNNVNDGENWYFSGSNWFEGAGTSALAGTSDSEVWASLLVKKEVCYKISSRLLGINVTSDADIMEGSLDIASAAEYEQFQGDFTNGTGIGDDANLRNYSPGKNAYCLYGQNEDIYLYIHLLIIR